MDEIPSGLERWRELHGRAAAAFRAGAEEVVDPDVATPAGHWSAADVIAHVRAEHGPDNAASIDQVEALQMLTLDLAVHSWDLGRSQGSTAELDDELCLALHAAFEPYTDLMAQEDAFAPPLPTPPDASPTTRLVALTGRDPDWSPPAPGR